MKRGRNFILSNKLYQQAFIPVLLQLMPSAQTSSVRFCAEPFGVQGWGQAAALAIRAPGRWKRRSCKQNARGCWEEPSSAWGGCSVLHGGLFSSLLRTFTRGQNGSWGVTELSSLSLRKQKLPSFFCARAPPTPSLPLFSAHLAARGSLPARQGPGAAGPCPTRSLHPPGAFPLPPFSPPRPASPSPGGRFPRPLGSPAAVPVSRALPPAAGRHWRQPKAARPAPGKAKAEAAASGRGGGGGGRDSGKVRAAPSAPRAAPIELNGAGGFSTMDSAHWPRRG